MKILMNTEIVYLTLLTVDNSNFRRYHVYLFFVRDSVKDNRNIDFEFEFLGEMDFSVIHCFPFFVPTFH